jgi:hypothetical protein
MWYQEIDIEVRGGVLIYGALNTNLSRVRGFECGSSNCFGSSTLQAACPVSAHGSHPMLSANPVTVSFHWQQRGALWCLNYNNDSVERIPFLPLIPQFITALGVGARVRVAECPLLPLPTNLQRHSSMSE